jgi:hypothetical protein
VIEIQQEVTQLVRTILNEAEVISSNLFTSLMLACQQKKKKKIVTETITCEFHVKRMFLFFDLLS